MSSSYYEASGTVYQVADPHAVAGAAHRRVVRQAETYVYSMQVVDLENGVVGQLGVLVQNSGGNPQNVPQTLKGVDLPGRIRAAGGASLKEAGEFFGWEPARVTKAAADFTKGQLLAQGWTKPRLLDVAAGYEHIARITPNNPSAAGRAAQLREIAKLLD